MFGSSPGRWSPVEVIIRTAISANTGHLCQHHDATKSVHELVRSRSPLAETQAPQKSCLLVTTVLLRETKVSEQTSVHV